MNSKPFAALCAVSLLSLTALAMRAQSAPKLSPNQQGPSFAPCERREIAFNGRRAYKLSNGVTEAVIVPELGRVMSYGFVGGENQLWNNSQEAVSAAKPGEWINYGGDKSWAAPQDFWPVLSGTNSWPPDKAWDGSPHFSELIPNGVRTISPVSRFNGSRCARDYGFNAQGDFLVSQLFEKLRGPRVMMSIWSIAQVPHPEVVFLRLNPNSTYAGGFHGYGKAKSEFDTSTVGDVLQLKPSLKDFWKVGVDSPVAHIVSLRKNVLFSLRTPKPEGTYPDGAAGAGFPVEIYNAANPAYEELELLGPLQLYVPGRRYRHTMTWSLRRVPQGANASQLAAQMLRQE